MAYEDVKKGTVLEIFWAQLLQVNKQITSYYSARNTADINSRQEEEKRELVAHELAGFLKYMFTCAQIDVFKQAITESEPEIQKIEKVLDTKIEELTKQYHECEKKLFTSLKSQRELIQIDMKNIKEQISELESIKANIRNQESYVEFIISKPKSKLDFGSYNDVEPEMAVYEKDAIKGHFQYFADMIFRHGSYDIPIKLMQKKIIDNGSVNHQFIDIVLNNLTYANQMTQIGEIEEGEREHLQTIETYNYFLERLSEIKGLLSELKDRDKYKQVQANMKKGVLNQIFSFEQKDKDDVSMGKEANDNNQVDKLEANLKRALGLAIPSALVEVLEKSSGEVSINVQEALAIINNLSGQPNAEQSEVSLNKEKVRLNTISKYLVEKLADNYDDEMAISLIDSYSEKATKARSEMQTKINECERKKKEIASILPEQLQTIVQNREAHNFAIIANGSERRGISRLLVTKLLKGLEQVDLDSTQYEGILREKERDYAKIKYEKMIQRVLTYLNDTVTDQKENKEEKNL